MFGPRRRYYVVEERRSNGGCLYGCLLLIVMMVALIAAILIFAWYAMLVVLALLFITGAVIGVFFGIKNSVKAFGDSFNKNRDYSRPNTLKATNNILKVLLVCKDHIVLGWKATVESVKGLFGKAEANKFWSFKRWMYLFMCLAVAFWGIIITALIVIGYLALLICATVIALVAIVVVILISLVISMPLFIWQFAKNFIYIFKAIRASYSQTAGTSVYLFNKGYRHTVSVFKNTVRKGVFDAKQKFRESTAYSWFAFKHWIPLWSGVLLVGLGTILLIPLFLLHVFCVTVAVVGYSVGIVFFRIIDAVVSVFAKKSARCPNIRCNKKVRRNVYVCECGETYKKLRPGTRGIFKRKCRCGKMVPCTAFTGKHKMRDLCPKCGFRINRQ